MIRMLTTSQGKTIYLLARADLKDTRSKGLWLRCFCPIHKSDHQRSLSIHSRGGWGRCFQAQCQALVLVEDLSREAKATAASLKAHARSAPLVASSRSDLPPLRLPARAREASPRATSSSDWQQQERAALLAAVPVLREALWQEVPDQAFWPGLAYLEERHIPFDLAQAEGIAYLPTSPLEEEANDSSERPSPHIPAPSPRSTCASRGPQGSRGNRALATQDHRGYPALVALPVPRCSTRLALTASRSRTVRGRPTRGLCFPYWSRPGSASRGSIAHR